MLISIIIVIVIPRRTQDELRELCVMDARSDDAPKKRESTDLVVVSVPEDGGEEGDIEESGVSDNDERRDMPPTPDTVPITTSSAMQETRNEIDAAAAGAAQIESTEITSNGLRTSEFAKRRGTADEVASFNT